MDPKLLELESTIDGDGLTATLENIAQICLEKAEHLRSNWQDLGAAKRWEKAAKIIDQMSAKINV